MTKHRFVLVSAVALLAPWSILAQGVQNVGRTVTSGKAVTISGEAAGPGSLSFATGNYVGNATAKRAVVTGLSFTPKVVMISSNAAVAGIIGITEMGADNATIVSGGGGAGILTSIDANGFTVSDSASVNANGITYIWWAMAGTELSTGTYTGDGADNHAITGVGFTPGFVMVVPAAALNLDVSFTGTAAAADQTFYGNGGSVANAIKSLDANGFTLGTAQSVNQKGTTYYWFAIDTSSTSMGQGSYAGNSTDDRDITGLSFDPEMVLIAPDAGAYSSYRTAGHTGDQAKVLYGATVATNYIQSFGTEQFQVGDSVYVNGAFTYYYWYFRDSP